MCTLARRVLLIEHLCSTPFSVPREGGLEALAVQSHTINVVSSFVCPSIGLLIEELPSASSYPDEDGESEVDPLV